LPNDIENNSLVLCIVVEDFQTLNTPSSSLHWDKEGPTRAILFFFYIIVYSSFRICPFSSHLAIPMNLLGAGTWTTALDSTFGSFTLSEPVSHYVNPFVWWKCLDCLDWNRLFWCSECGHST
jgi:hypothetical protein